MFIRPFWMQKLESKCISCLTPVMNAIDNAVVGVKDGVLKDFYPRPYQGFARCFYVYRWQNYTIGGRTTRAK